MLNFTVSPESHLINVHGRRITASVLSKHRSFHFKHLPDYRKHVALPMVQLLLQEACCATVTGPDSDVEFASEHVFSR